MTEYVSSTPQQFDTGFSLFLLCISNNCFQVCFIFFNSSSFFAKVNIVEAVIFDTHFLHELESGVHLILGCLYFISITIPGELFGTATELVAAFCAECVPPCHSKLQPVFHFLAHDDFFCIIVAESHWVLTFFTFEFNFSYSGKILFCCHNSN